jgi:DNA-binding transcriptional MocR family regulator
LFFWVKLAREVDTRPLLPKMLERGVAFMPGEASFPEAEPAKGFMRLNFSHATAEQMDVGLAKLAAALSE